MCALPSGACVVFCASMQDTCRNVEAKVLGTFCSVLAHNLHTPYLKHVAEHMARFLLTDCMHERSPAFNRCEFVNRLADVMWNTMPANIHGLAVILGVPVKHYWKTIMQISHVDDRAEWRSFWAYMQTTVGAMVGPYPELNLHPVGRRDQFHNRICSAVRIK